MITRKSPEQIALMRRAGRVVAEMHQECTRAAKPGATTADLLITRNCIVASASRPAAGNCIVSSADSLTA